MEETLAQEKIIGYSPKAVRVHALGIKALFVPFFGVFFGIAALAQSKSAKREIFDSRESLRGYDLCRKGITYAWLSFVSLLFNLTIIGLVIWAVQQIPLWLENPMVQSILQDGATRLLEGTGVIPGLDSLNIDGLGLSSSDLESLKLLLPEGTDINNLTLDDILELAKQYGIN
jgi:hypothetical protein